MVAAWRDPSFQFERDEPHGVARIDLANGAENEPAVVGAIHVGINPEGAFITAGGGPPREIGGKFACGVVVWEALVHQKLGQFRIQGPAEL